MNQEQEKETLKLKQKERLRQSKYYKAQKAQEARENRKTKLLQHILGNDTVQPPPAPEVYELQFLVQRRQEFQNQLSKQFGNALDPIAYRRAPPEDTTLTKSYLYGQ